MNRIVAVAVVAVGMASAGAQEAPPPPAEGLPTEPTTDAVPVAEPAPAEPADGAATASPVTRAPGLSIGEIVVTAQKREESINDVPVAISAFKGEDMQALGITDTRNLQSLVPGFTAADNGYNTPVYTLRGIGYNDTTYTATSTVGVYMDEVSMPYSVMTKGANLDLERVEVLKGPQGTLYGRNTTGGAINYIARKPTDAFEYGLTGIYGRFDTGEVEGYVSGPLADTLRGRLAARAVRAYDGWQYSNTRDDTLGEKRKASARALLDWAPGDDWQVRFLLDGWLDRSDAQAAQAIAIRPQNPFIPNTPTAVTDIPGIGPVLGDVIPYNVSLSPLVANYPLIDVDTDNVRIADWPYGVRPAGARNNPHGIGGGPWELDDHYWHFATTAKSALSEHARFTGIASYGEVESDGSAIPNSGLDVQNTEQVIDARIKSSSLELRLDGDAGDAWTWLGGVNVNYDDGYEFHHVWVPTVSAVFPDPVTGTSQITTEGLGSGDTQALSLGAFGKVDWQFADTLQASLGLRFSDEKRDFRGCFSEPVTSTGLGFQALIGAVSLVRYQQVNLPPKGTCINLDAQGRSGDFTDTLKEHNLSGRAALTWTPAERQLYYLSFSRGYKSGGFPVVNASFQEQYEATRQEKLLAWEIGSKTTLFPGVFHVNTALFHYKYTDKQLLAYFLDPVFGVLPIAVNVPRSTVRGAELDFQLTPLQGLFLSVAGSYIDTRVDEYTGLNADGDVQDFKGRSFNFTPQLQVSALVDYSAPLGTRYTAGAGVDYTYTDRTNATIEGDPVYTMRSNGMLGARLRVGTTDGRWMAMLWGRNLTDEYSALGIFRTGDAVARTTGQPRTYGVTLSYNGF